MWTNGTDRRWPAARDRPRPTIGGAGTRLERQSSRGIPASLFLRAARELGPTGETPGRTPRTTVCRAPRDTRRETEGSNGRGPHRGSHASRGALIHTRYKLPLEG